MAGLSTTGSISFGWGHGCREETRPQTGRSYRCFAYPHRDRMPYFGLLFKHLLVDPLGLVGMRAEVNPRGFAVVGQTSGTVKQPERQNSRCEPVVVFFNKIRLPDSLDLVSGDLRIGGQDG